MSRASSIWLILPVCVVWYVCGCGGVCLNACVCGGMCLGACVCVCACVRVWWCVCMCMCTLPVVHSTGLGELLRISTG